MSHCHSRQTPALMRGFSLVELLFTMAVAAVLLTLAVSSFTGVDLSSKLTSNATRLSTSATLARSEAIKRNALIKLCMSANGTACATTGQWEQGWIVVDEANALVVLYEKAAPSGFKITASPSVTSLSFQPTGVGSTQASFTICQATPQAGSQERVVSVSATGRTSVKRTTAGVCS